MTYKIINDCWGKTKHWYINENEFVFDGVNYEKDEYTGRCYYLEESRCLRADCDGKLVKRRISAKEYAELLGKCKAECAELETKEIIENKKVESMYLRLDPKKLLLKMTESGLNQKALAERAGVSMQIISAVMSGRYCCPQLLGKIARALRVDPEEIIED